MGGFSLPSRQNIAWHGRILSRKLVETSLRAVQKVTSDQFLHPNKAHCVTPVTRVTQTVNVGKNRQENASSPTHSTEKKKNHPHDRQKRIRRAVPSMSKLFSREPVRLRKAGRPELRGHRQREEPKKRRAVQEARGWHRKEECQREWEPGASERWYCGLPSMHGYC